MYARVSFCAYVCVFVFACVFSIHMRQVFLHDKAKFLFFYIKNLGLKTGVDSISVFSFSDVCCQLKKAAEFVVVYAV